MFHANNQRVPARRRKDAHRLLPTATALIALVLGDICAVAADADAVKEKAEGCVGCHGENGVSEIEGTPSLAGQPDAFTQWQLVFFRSGARKNEVMTPIAEQLSNEDVRDLAAYFASLNPSDHSQNKGSDDQPQLTEEGKRAAAAGRCAACHGDDFAGSKAAARIAGQREEYIAKALHDYKSGGRSGGGVAAMAEVTYPLSEQDITALAHYLARFRRE
jgi:cytochrome c553